MTLSPGKMDNGSLRDLEVFVAIAEEGNLTAAARRLDRSLQAVSRSLQVLEREAGTLLVARTTRQCRLTTAGEQFYTRIKQVLADLAMARAELAEYATTVTGRLRICGPTLFGPRYLAPLLAAFLARYPQLTASLDLSEEYDDPAVSGADVTIRIGETPDSNLIARRLGTIRRVTFASPAYLEARGRPLRPADLMQHDCVVRSALPEASLWRYRSKRGVEEAVQVRGRFESNSTAAINDAVASGLGIGRAAYWQIGELVQQRRVELILTDYELSPLPLQALWLPTRRLPARTRLFVEFLAARLESVAL